MAKIPIPGEELVKSSLSATLRKMSPFAASLSICIVFFAASSGLVIWIAGPTYLEAQRIAADANHMRQAHENCETRLAALESKVRELEARWVAAVGP